MENNTTYYGSTRTDSVGLASPGVEFHAEFGMTGTVQNTQFNIFDEARKIYIKIMEC